MTFEAASFLVACPFVLALVLAAILVDVAPPNGNSSAPMTRNAIDTPSGPSFAKICQESLSNDLHRANIAPSMTAKERPSGVSASAFSKLAIPLNRKPAWVESKCGGKFFKRTESDCLKCLKKVCFDPDLRTWSYQFFRTKFLKSKLRQYSKNVAISNNSFYFEISLFRCDFASL